MKSILLKPTSRFLRHWGGRCSTALNTEFKWSTFRRKRQISMGFYEFERISFKTFQARKRNPYIIMRSSNYEVKLRLKFQLKKIEIFNTLKVIKL